MPTHGLLAGRRMPSSLHEDSLQFPHKWTPLVLFGDETLFANCQLFCTFAKSSRPWRYCYVSTESAVTDLTKIETLRDCRHKKSIKRFGVFMQANRTGWLGSRVVSVLDSGTERRGFKSQSRRCRVTVLGKLFTPVVPLFTKQQNW